MSEPTCEHFGERPDDDGTHPECRSCSVVLRCSILSLKQIACISKKSVEVCYDEKNY